MSPAWPCRAGRRSETDHRQIDGEGGRPRAPSHTARPGLGRRGLATGAEHRERVTGTASRWLEAARAYVDVWAEAHPDGVPSVRQKQLSQAERLARQAYERELAARRSHLRGERHDT